MPRLLVLILLALAAFLAPAVRAQTLTISEELPLRNDTEYHLIGKLGGQTLLFEDRDPRYFLTAFGSQMNQTWDKEIELRGRGIRLMDVLPKYDNTAFHLLYLFRDGGKNFLQLDRIDPGGNLQDSVTLVEFGGFMNNPIDEVFRSEDGTKALVLIDDTQQKIRCLGIDLENGALLYDNLLEPEKFFFNEDFLQAEISNDGDMYFFAQQDNFRSKRKAHRYRVFTFDNASQSSAEHEISLGDSLTYDVVFKYDNLNDRIAAAGLYSTRDFVRAEGYFFVTAEPAGGKAINTTFHPFPLDLVKNVEGKRYNKRNPGINEISVREGILRRDGGMILITERNRQLQRRSAAAQAQVFNNFNGRPLVDHHYNEIVAFAIFPNGRAHWSNIMHKKQYSQDDGGVFSSYLLMESPRYLRFLFNDEIRFENTVSEYVLNGRGEFDRNSLFHTRDLELRLRFRDGVQTAANEVILPSEHKNRMRLVRMTYEGK